MFKPIAQKSRKLLVSQKYTLMVMLVRTLKPGLMLKCILNRFPSYEKRNTCIKTEKE